MSISHLSPSPTGRVGMLAIGLVLTLSVPVSHADAPHMLGAAAAMAQPITSQNTDEALREQVALDGWVRVRVNLQVSEPAATTNEIAVAASQDDDIEQTLQDVLFAMPLGSYKDPKRETDSAILHLQVDAAGLDALLVAPAVTAVVAAEPPEMRQIAAGDGHSLAIKSDGSLWAWGSNAKGQIGDTTKGNSRPRPVQVYLQTGVIAVAAGNVHTVALKNDRSLWAWGDNFFGQIGDGTSSQRPSPVQVMSDVAAVVTSHFHTLARKTDGSLWAWGLSDYGQIGDGTKLKRLSPVQVMTDVAAAATGREHSLAIKTDGSLWAWGSNARGQMGVGKLSSAPELRPVQVMTDVTAVAAGYAHTLALKTDGGLWAWGSNTRGQIGDGTPASRVPRLSPVLVMTDVVAVAAGGEHSLAIKTDGSLWAWGYNQKGQIGDSTKTNRLSPFRVMTNVVAVAGGWQHTLARKTDGILWAWGYNWRYELGNGGRDDAVTPVQVSGFGSSATLPSAPSTLSATAIYKTRIKLNWRDTSDNETGFRIERKTGSGDWTPIGEVKANVKTFVSAGLTGATTYSFRVQAFHAYGTSAYSNVITAKTR